MKQQTSTITNTTFHILGISEILLLLKPISELGWKATKNIFPYSSKDQEALEKYFSLLQKLILLGKKNPQKIKKIISLLHHFLDIEYVVKSINIRPLEMHEFFEIKNFVYQYLQLMKIIASEKIIPKRNFQALYQLLDPDHQDGTSFYLSSQYSNKLKRLRATMNVLTQKKEALFQDYQAKIMHELKISILNETITVARKNERLKIQLIDSGYFDLCNENFANYTLKLKIPAAILQLEKKIHFIREAQNQEAKKILLRLSQKIMIYQQNLFLALQEISFFDLLLAKSIFAKNYQCSIPKILPQNNTIIFEGKNTFNLLLQKELHQQGLKYQKINLKITEKINVFSGGNMCGKTCALKNIGQIAYLTSLGFPVPAEMAHTKLFDHIIYSGPNALETRPDLSSFGQEVHTLQTFIQNQGFNLLLLDEFGRGTNPEEGEQLYHAVLQYFLEQNNQIVISATHYSLPSTEKKFSHFQILGITKKQLLIIKKHLLMNSEEKIRLLNEKINYQPVEVMQDTKIPQLACQIAEILGLEKEIIQKIKFSTSSG